MEQGKILYAKKDAVCIIKAVGTITCHTVTGFDTFINQLAHDADINDVLIDLCYTAYIDSTNLGLLAEIARIMQENGKKKPTIVTVNERINEVIENMGLHKVFTVLSDSADDTEEYSEIPETDQDEDHRARTILRAHKNIMAISEKNRFLFKDVVELLEDQIQKHDTDN